MEDDTDADVRCAARPADEQAFDMHTPRRRMQSNSTTSSRRHSWSSASSASLWSDDEITRDNFGETQSPNAFATLKPKLGSFKNRSRISSKKRALPDSFLGALTSNQSQVAMALDLASFVNSTEDSPSSSPVPSKMLFLPEYSPSLASDLASLQLTPLSQQNKDRKQNNTADTTTNTPKKVMSKPRIDRGFFPSPNAQRTSRVPAESAASTPSASSSIHQEEAVVEKNDRMEKVQS